MTKAINRATSRVVQRYADTAYGDRLAELFDGIAPVIVVGSDSIDEERAVYVSAQLIIPGGGNVGRADLFANTADVQIVSAWAACRSGPLRLRVEFIAPSNFSAPVQLTGSANGSTNARAFFSIVTDPGTSRMFEAPQDTTLFLPFAGMILERGRVFRLQGASPADDVTLGFAWRNAGPAIDLL